MHIQFAGIYLTYDEIIKTARSIVDSGKPIPPSEAKEILDLLRRHRDFGVLRDLAEFLTQIDPNNPLINKLYAQALIDSGLPALGRDILTASLARTSPGNSEFVDMHGVLGRAYKDIVALNLARGQKNAAARAARASFEAYNLAYMIDRDSVYHEINVAALSTYVENQGIDIGSTIDPARVSAKIIKKIKAKPSSERDAWDLATLAEAHISLGKLRIVEKYLIKYISHPEVNAFQIGGTLRQFRDIWGIGGKGKRGARLLKLLEAAYCQFNQEHHTFESHTLHSTPEHVRDVVETSDIDAATLEKTLGRTGTLSFEWYRTGMIRAMSVASVITEAGRRRGTAFAIDHEGLGLPDLMPGEQYMMTNFHVLNSKDTGALDLGEAHVRFEAMSNKKFKAQAIAFESSFVGGGLDVTIFTIKCNKKVEKIPLSFRDLEAPVDGQRVYVIGYPDGGELGFSLQDNHLLDHECAQDSKPPVKTRRRLHYFAPTEPGSSGSPVFDEEWRCIALHHAGEKYDPLKKTFGLKMLNGKADEKGNNRYSANEGIWITSIKSAVGANS